MPILDKNGNQLASFDAFPINAEVQNIEFGAGISYFGKREFPNCFLTDVQSPRCDHFKQHPEDYETKECHFLDSECDYLHTDFGGKTFYNLIFCNPYDMGFLGPGHAIEFIERAAVLLKEEGQIHILGSTKNPWSSSRKIKKYLGELIASGVIEIVVVALDLDHSYITDYEYKQSDLVTTTKPNELTIIKKLTA